LGWPGGGLLPNQLAICAKQRRKQHQHVLAAGLLDRPLQSKKWLVVLILCGCMQVRLVLAQFDGLLAGYNANRGGQ
jgi:hypothetical protein